MTLEEKIGQLLVVGFQGCQEGDKHVDLLCRQIQQGIVGGIILFGYNIESPEQVKFLNAFLKEQSRHLPLLVTVDQEGGQVERLSPKKGFKGFKTPKMVAQMSTADALKHYEALAEEVLSCGFNLDFAPCVDKDPIGYIGPVIGGLNRSYGTDIHMVIRYAAIMMQALKKYGVLNSIKHFPGHGSALGDTHEGFVDVSEQWHEEELEPFFSLVRKQVVDTVMTAHIFNKYLDPIYPATFSKNTLLRLRNAGYTGVIISDDLHMSAIQKHYSFKDSIINAFAAGNDMVIFSNNPAAAKGVEGFVPDPYLPEKFLKVITDAIKSEHLSARAIEVSFERVQSMKKRLA